MEQSDGELLLACRNGNEAAWETLIHRYQRLIYAIPRRAGLDEEQAADVFQEVFKTFFEKLNDIEQPDRLQAWLVTIARRKTLRLASRENRLRRSFDDQEESAAELNNITDDALLPDEALLHLEEQHGVRTALHALDERCRKLLTLLFYSEEPPSYADIAAATGTSEGSIGPTRARCLKKMLHLLSE